MKKEVTTEHDFSIPDGVSEWYDRYDIRVLQAQINILQARVRDLEQKVDPKLTKKW